MRIVTDKTPKVDIRAILTADEMVSALDYFACKFNTKLG